MRYVLVLQWPASELDFDALVAMEDVLESGLDEAHGFVDGHDLGSGQMNIFVHTDTPLEAFADAARCLGSNARWKDIRAAFRPVEGERYEIVWPGTLEQFAVT